MPNSEHTKPYNLNIRADGPPVRFGRGYTAAAAAVRLSYAQQIH